VNIKENIKMKEFLDCRPWNNIQLRQVKGVPE
jgi:hypothetical protein